MMHLSIQNKGIQGKKVGLLKNAENLRKSHSEKGPASTSLLTSKSSFVETPHSIGQVAQILQAWVVQGNDEEFQWQIRLSQKFQALTCQELGTSRCSNNLMTMNKRDKIAVLAPSMFCIKPTTSPAFSCLATIPRAA